MNKPRNEDFAKATSLILSWKRPLLVSHTKPDGDALGSLVALRSLLKAQGVSATALLFDGLPDRYALFRRFPAFARLGRDVREVDLSHHDGIVLLDTCAASQLEPLAEWLRSTSGPKLAVDHHVTRDDLVDHYLIDETAAATCLILFDWAGAARWSIPSDAAEAILIGVATDTGWFRHSNTDTRVLSAAAELSRRGVRSHELYEALYQRETPARVRLLGAALSTLELHCEDRLAVMGLTRVAMSAVGATSTDTEDIVNEPLRIDSVVVSVLLVESDDGIIRVSLRSKPPVAAVAELSDHPVSAGAPPRRAEGSSRAMGVDVAEAARAFGGGGHTRAAGARIRGSLPDAKRDLVTHLETMLSP